MQFIEELQHVFIEISPPVFSIVVNKYHTCKQGSYTGEGIKF